MAEALSFKCPSCGAQIKSQGNAAQIQCEYCGSTVTVPEELRDNTIAISPETTRWIKWGIWGFIGFILLVTIVPLACSLCGVIGGLASAFVPFFIR
jgi:DNA-directed RNA polymerase subunit RPC12/RpoP